MRNKTGVLYSNPVWWKKIFFYFGSTLTIFSLIFILYIYGPIIRGWIRYKLIDQSTIAAQIEEIKEIAVIPTKTIPKPTSEPEPIIESDEFNVLIPKIGAEADVEIGVSTSNKAEYMAVLKNNMVAQALGTGLPGDGEGSSMFLFAHSSEQGVFDARDNPVFYLLGNLEENDDILINYRGKIFVYRVYTKRIIGAKETNYLRYTEPDKEIVILQTCWPIGTNWQRLLVFARRI